MSLHPRDAELLAAIAWNTTKAADDPIFAACTPEHKSKLFAIINSVERGIPAGVTGLEAFEAAVSGELAEVVPVIAPLLLPTSDEGAIDVEDLPEITT